MRIAIDSREIRGTAGKARYVRELILALSKIDQENEYFLYVWEKPEMDLAANFEFITLPKDKIRLLWLRHDLKTRGIDVFLSPTGYHPVIFSSVPSVLVVHDLAVFVDPHSRPELKTMLIEKLSLPWALSRANHIISDSENTRQDIIRRFGTSQAKITTVLLSAFEHSKQMRSDNEVREKYHLPERFVLYVGTLEPRKNVDGLVYSYAGLDKGLREKYPLVLAGRRGWHYEAIDEAIRKSGLGKTIIETGYLEDGDLPAIYKMATAFAYPSWYEGFGLPPLEAMGYGVPVVTSNTSSLPEVVGDSAFLVDPSDEKELTQALEKLLTSGKLREKLILQGKRQAEKFSWVKSATETLEILKKVGKHG